VTQYQLDSPEWTNADLSAHLGMIVESYRDFASKRNIDLQFVANERMQTDFVPEYINKLVNNLLSNAFKFTPRYGRVSVKVAREGANAVISVIDTGVGIAPDAIPHLFELFYKVGADASQQGTGIGLALVRQIVDALDGCIMVESVPEKGSTFVVRLPIRNVCKPSNMVATHGNTPLLSQTEERLDDEANHNNDEQRMLIVEDNADLGAYIGSLFSAHYAVYYATNGTEALSKAMELVPDIIITDRMMPGVDGLEVCRKVRQSDVLNHIPIVVVTGKITEQERLEGIKAGADAYINKPFNSEELITMVEKLLDRHQNLRKKYAENSNETTEENDHRTEAERQFLTKVADFTYLLLDNHALDVNALAEKLNMSVRQFHRKLVALTGNTPGVFILNLKMQKAKLLLETKYELTIEDISERCGFEHASSFYHAFKKAFGITPAEYRKKRG
jgi:DNA-binding response regulator/sensor histidine kinase